MGHRCYFRNALPATILRAYTCLYPQIVGNEIEGKFIHRQYEIPVIDFQRAKSEMKLHNGISFQTPFFLLLVYFNRSCVFKRIQRNLFSPPRRIIFWNAWAATMPYHFSIQIFPFLCDCGPPSFSLPLVPPANWEAVCVNACFLLSVPVSLPGFLLMVGKDFLGIKTKNEIEKLFLLN